MKNKEEDKEEEDLSQPARKIHKQENNSQKFLKNWEELNLKEDIPNFIKNQAYFNEEKGKK